MKTPFRSESAAYRYRRSKRLVSGIIIILALLGELILSSPGWAATLSSGQSGTTVIGNGSPSATATISTIDPGKAFLVFGASIDASNPEDVFVAGQISNATTLTFDRAGTLNPVTIHWYVAEFSSGVSIQRGTVTPTLATTTVSLSPAVDPAKAFPIVTNHAQNGDTTYNSDNFVQAKIINGGADLELRFSSAPGSGAHVEWQVIEYADATVQTGDENFGAFTLSHGAGTTFDLAKSWLVYSYRSDDGTSSNVGQKLVRGTLEANNVVTERNNSGQALNITWYLVEFTDGTVVQHGSQAFGSTETQKNITLSSVDPTASIAAGGHQMRGGKSPYTTGNIGIGWFTQELTSATNLQVTRNRTGATADFGWFVVEFEATASGPDIVIDCDFSDWTNGSGTEFLVDDQGGNDDWNNPQKLDITRFGVASNLIDTFYVLYGYDETPPNGTAAVQIDTDLDDLIDFALAVDVDGGGSTVELYSCDNTLAYGCGNATLSKTYSTPADYCVGTAAGPWNTDTFVEVAIPYADLGSFVGGTQILTSLNSYNQGFWQNPKDSIFEDFYDRILYDTDDGTGQIIDDAGTPIITGTVYADEGTTPVGSGKTVRLLVNGVDTGSDTTNANGDYLIITPVSAGDAIAVYIDDDATYQGSTVTIFDGVQVGGLDIYAGHVIARHDNGGTLNNSDMGTAKGAYSDSDILYSVSGGNLNVTGSGTELYIHTGHRFAPAGDITTPHMKNLGRTLCGSGTIDINGTLTLAGNGFGATSGIMNIAGDFVNTGDIFSHNSGTVTLDGSGQNISGSTNFFSLIKSISAADTLTFEAGSSQSFAADIALLGDAGNLLSLRSSVNGTRFNFTVNAGATKKIAYVDVKDSDASGSDATQKPINPSNSTNSGNTIDWFPPSPLLEQTHYRWRNDDGTENGDWWDSNYGYRRKVVFGTSHSMLPLGFTVSATMDTRPSTANVALTNGNDVRLVWQPSGGGAVELDRLGDTWNNAGTSIEFRLQSQITANANEDADGSYYIYYGYALAGTPPADEKNVYYFADFFNRTNGPTVGNGWTEWDAGAGATISGNTMHQAGNNAGPADTGIKQNFPLGAITSDFTISFDWMVPVNGEGTWTVYTHIGDSMDNASRTTGVAFGLYAGEGSHFIPNNLYNITSNLAGPAQLEEDINGTHSFMLKVNYAAKTFDYWRGGVERSTNVAFLNAGTSLSQIRMANDQYTASAPDFVWDNLKIVLNVSDNPEEALDTEQTYVGSGSGASFALDENFKYENLQKGGSNHIRLRFLVSNEGTGGESVAYELQVAEVSTSNGSECAAATYYAVNDAVNELQWDLYPTINISAGGTDTTSNIGDGIDDALPDPGGGNFVAGRLVDDDDQTAIIKLDLNNFTEIEFSVQANNNATDGDEFCFRLGRPGGTALDSYNTYSYGLVNIGLGPTAVDLVSLTATGSGNDVRIDWLTGHEINNLGFNIYRAQSPAGPYQKINAGLIPGLDYSALGKSYSYTDADVTPGTFYYYKLEDIDAYGTRTFHGPVCVDWDADGMPDDWEIAHGLNPWVNDADLDSDGDGLSNLQEYELGFDPFNADSDGDGILDGEQAGIVKQPDDNGSRVLMRGVEVIAEDETGVTLELITDAFYTETLTVDGDEFERLRIDEYIHGYTAAIGQPEMPQKGILIDIPEDQAAALSILETEVQTHLGYQIYPLPQAIVDVQRAAVGVGESFIQDQGVYDADVFYPQDVAGLAEVYTFRDQKKQQVIFYPLAFNPSSGDLRHYKRIRVRIDYVNDLWASATDIAPTPWKVPGADNSLSSQISSMGSMAAAFSASPLVVNPLAPSLSSIGVILSAVWAPPTDFGNSAYKVLTQGAGIYRIYRTDLALNDDLSAIRLHHLGEEVAIYIYDQDGDDYLDASDYIEFYAEPVAEAYAKYARYNVYWLVTAGGTGTPRRMAAVDGNPATGALASEHRFLQHSEDDAIYRGDAPGEDGLERWYYSQFVLGTGFTFTADPVAAHFALPVYDNQAPGRLTVSLWGYADTDHEMQVWVNGVYKNTFYWSGIAYHEAVIDTVDVKDSVINQSAQAGSANTITLAAEASDIDDTYNEMLIEITAGQGAGQVRKIIDYIGATKVATVESNWSDPPDTTSVYRIDTAVTLYCDSGDDAFVVDYFELTYDRSFSAINNQLQFAHDSGYRYVIDEFSTNDLLIFDISDPLNVAYIENATVAGSDPYDISFEPPANPGATEIYLIISSDNYKSPVSISQDVSSDLADTDHQIDYIIITHKDIGWDGGGNPNDWLDDLVNLREDGGLSVKAVDIEDIYDEFSYGLYSPVAIRDFLAYAYSNWQTPAPQYVILVGDGSFDYKDNLNIGTINYVPGYMVDTAYMGEAITDEYFVKISGDDALPDMYIGRLPAASEAQAQAMVDKIKSYEEILHAKDWRQNVLLLADDQVEDYEAIFETMNEDAAALMPSKMTALRGYLGSSTPAAINSFIDTTIGSGALIMNYSGHGALKSWGSPFIFEDTHVSSLDNNGKYPFVIGMSCLAGNFGFVSASKGQVPSLAETLLLADAEGAVAAFMPTAMTTTPGQRILNAALFEALFSDDIRGLGPAILSAKQVLLANGGAVFEEVSETFLLFGDPALGLKIPLPRMPTGVAAYRESSGVRISWNEAADSNGNPVAGYHVYRATSAAGPYVRISTELITDTGFMDTSSEVGADAGGGDSYYYAVSSEDTDGDESVQSLGVRPAVLASSGGAAAGCFIGTVTPVNCWHVLSMFVALALVVLISKWYRVNGIRYKASKLSSLTSKNRV